MAELEQHAVGDRLAAERRARGAERDRHAEAPRDWQDAADLGLVVDLLRDIM